MADRRNRERIKIAWALNSGFYYWHPLIASFTKIWSRTKLFTVNWEGYLPGYEDAFECESLGNKKVISFKKNLGGYNYNIAYLPLNIINKLLAEKPQVVFVNSFGIWTLLILLFKPIGRWRVVILHEGCSPNVDYRNSRSRLFIRRLMMKATDACLTNGESGKDFLIKVLKLHSEKVFVYPYPLPPSRSFTVPQNLPELTDLQRPIFLFVGQVVPRKGLDLLLEAALFLKEEGRSNYTILVVGDGEDRQKLEAYCSDRDLDRNVIWTGKVEYDRLPGYFQLADVFILPALEDVWGVVVLEAMMAGKAVLCSQFAGAVEMIAEAENGYSFDPRDRHQLAELMGKFLEDRNLAGTMGAKSQEIMETYTPENGAKLLTEIVEFVLPAVKEN